MIKWQCKGRTSIFHRDLFQVCKVSHGEKSSFEYSEWCVSWHNHCITLCIVYHQPYSVSNPVTDPTFIQDFESYLDTLVLADEILYITGDFNLHIDDPTDTYVCQFNYLLSSIGLINNITFPTHQTGHTLDLVITWDNQEIELRSIKPHYFLSDHCFVCVEIIVARLDVQRRKLSYCKFKSIDKSFRNDLKSICQDLLLIDDLNELATQYNSRLLILLNKHIPVKSEILTVHPRVPWFSPTVKNLKRDRRKAERSWRSDMFNPVSHSKFRLKGIDTDIHY